MKETRTKRKYTRRAKGPALSNTSEQRTDSPARVEPKLPAIVATPDVGAIVAVNPEALIARAIDKGVPLEQMERLLAMRRELKAEWARGQYFTALASFQRFCPVIGKDSQVDFQNKRGGRTKYRYATLDKIVAQVKDLLEKHGFSYVIRTEQTPDQVKAVCVAHHRDGHEEATDFTVPVDHEAYMNDAQKVASALTYSKRYAFCNAFGIMTGDEDDDARSTNHRNTTEAEWTPDAEDKPVERAPAFPPPDTPTGKPAHTLGNRLTTLIMSPLLTEEERAEIRTDYRGKCTTDKQRGDFLAGWEKDITERAKRPAQDDLTVTLADGTKKEVPF